MHWQAINLKSPLRPPRVSVDESLGSEFAATLRELGYDAVAGQDKDARIVLTQQPGFLDDRIIPLNRDTAFVSALMSALSIIGEGRVVVHGNGKLTVTNGRRVTHYKLRVTGSPLVWNSVELIDRSWQGGRLRPA
jgi:hypothetical protein